MKICLDICCLCRPFDDQRNRKIRLEAEYVLAILERCNRDWSLVGNDVINLKKPLGPADMKQFIQSFENGSSNYPKERHQWLPEKLEDLKEDLLELQKERKVKK